MGLCIGSITAGSILFMNGIKSGEIPPPMLPLRAGAILIVIALTVLSNTYSIISIVLMDDDFVWIRGPKNRFSTHCQNFRAMILMPS
jgi:hypothetical protein